MINKTANIILKNLVSFIPSVKTDQTYITANIILVV